MDALIEVESEVIDMDDTEKVENEACLLGRLVTKKNWNLSNLIEAITKAWKPKHGMSSKELGESKLILFRFGDAIERDWVLKNQPWIFKGYLLAIEKFTVGNEQQLSSSVNVTVEHASFWARLYDVPFSCMNERSLRPFAKQIGILESVDIRGEDLIGRFIRFKVSMNITKPLLTGITIRVKGKHLWLPLKYESLPTYCFSCGIIGHDHKNCHSYNRNLKYSTLKLKGIEEGKDTPTTLPREIIENILSRVPTKSLIRYKSVCKLWEAMISDPGFAEFYLQQNKKSSSQNLLAWEGWFHYEKGLYVAEIKCQCFLFVSRIQHSRKYSLSANILCYCDGLYLNVYETLDNGNAYFLWNPSCRAYKEIWCPQPIIHTGYITSTFYGIYYDALMKDYKIVIADKEHYAVFSCRYDKWSEVKEMKDITFKGAPLFTGVSFNGSFYWLSHDNSISMGGDIYDYEINWFDGKVEKFKKLPIPERREISDWLYLTSSESHLCMLMVSVNNDMSIWKKVNGDEKDPWIEFKVQRSSCPVNPRPICWINDDVVMLDIYETSNFYHLYDQKENTFVKIQKNNLFQNYDPLIYRENLFLQ